VDQALEQAYAGGDHRSARVIARQLVSTSDDPEQVARAHAVLAATAADPFLAVVGALGLGLVAWLVYNYVL
jgi:uncharacterized protein (DUF2062 family)